VTFALYFQPPPAADDPGRLPDGAHVRGENELQQGHDDSTPTAHPDFPLVYAIRAGDPRALETLVHQYFRPLTLFAAHIVGTHDAAEDIAQAVLYRVWERRHDWTPRAGIRAYLFAAARNAAFDARKHARVRTRHHTRLIADFGESDQSADVDDTVRLRRQFRAVFAALTERQRTALRLRYEQQLSAREIAIVLGVSIRAVERLLARAIDILRDGMTR